MENAKASESCPPGLAIRSLAWATAAASAPLLVASPREALRDYEKRMRTRTRRRMGRTQRREKVPPLASQLRRQRARAFAKEAGRPPKRLWPESGANQPASGWHSEFCARVLARSPPQPAQGQLIEFEGPSSSSRRRFEGGHRPQNTERESKRMRICFARAVDAEISILPLRLPQQGVPFEEPSIAQQDQ